MRVLARGAPADPGDDKGAAASGHRAGLTINAVNKSHKGVGLLWTR